MQEEILNIRIVVRYVSCLSEGGFYCMASFRLKLLVHKSLTKKMQNEIAE
jgi:hypothetical protein